MPTIIIPPRIGASVVVALEKLNQAGKPLVASPGVITAVNRKTVEVSEPDPENKRKKIYSQEERLTVDVVVFDARVGPVIGLTDLKVVEAGDLIEVNQVLVVK